jgi:hypothetical protein
MRLIDYNRQLLGFVVRDGGISHEAWWAFASSSPWLRKQPPVEGINPFTQRPHYFSNSNFVVTDGAEHVGLLAWEESECVGVAGEEPALRSVIASLCEAFDAQFEPIER